MCSTTELTALGAHGVARLSMDNGAMVAQAAAFRLAEGDVAPGDVSARANLPFPNLSAWEGRKGLEVG